jgi:hypothetical protein
MRLATSWTSESQEFSPRRPDWFWGPPNLLSNGLREDDLSSSTIAEVKKNACLHIHSPIHLRGVLNQLSIGKCFPFFYGLRIREYI